MKDYDDEEVENDSDGEIVRFRKKRRNGTMTDGVGKNDQEHWEGNEGEEGKGGNETGKEGKGGNESCVCGDIKLKEHLNCWVVGLRLEDLESAKIVNFCDSSCTSVWGKVSSVVPAFLCQFLPTRRGGIYLSRNETSNYCAFHMLNVSLRATDFSAGQKARTHGAF